MRKRDLCCHRCLSVRLSRWCILSTRLKISSNFFLRPVDPSLIPGADTQLQENPFSGGEKYTGWAKFAIFDRNRRLSRKRYEIGPWLLLNACKKSCALSNDDIFNDLHGPLSRFSRSRHFYVGYLKNVFDPSLRTSYY